MKKANKKCLTMSRKREKPSSSAAGRDSESDSDSMEDMSEGITFLPVSKEERKQQERMLREANGEDEESESEEDDDVDLINVDFEFSDPKEAHFKSVRNLLRYLLLGSGKEIDLSPLAEAVVNQVELGSVVQLNGEEDAYAFLTLLHLQSYKVSFSESLLVRTTNRSEPF